MRPQIIRAFTGDPWEDVSMPEGFDPDKNRFLNPPLRVPVLDFMDSKHNVNAREETSTRTRTMGEKKSQEQWIEYAKTFPEETCFASMGDFYRIFRFAVLGIEEQQIAAVGLPGPGYISEALYARGKLVIANTRIEYKQGTLEATIVNNPQTKREKRQTLEVPDYRVRPYEIISDTKGLAFMQALFDTEDNGDTIVKVIRGVFGDSCKTLYTMPHTERSIPFSVCGFEFRPEDQNVPEKLKVMGIYTDLKPDKIGMAYAAVYKEIEASR